MAKTASDRPLRIGALARATRLSPDAIRHYERLGILAPPARTAGNFRQYPPAAIRRVRTVQAALAIGFTLRELGPIFRERDAGRAPCARVRALAGRKLEALDAHLHALTKLRRTLRRSLVQWDRRLAQAGPGERAGLLDALADEMAPVPEPPRGRRALTTWRSA